MTDFSKRYLFRITHIDNVKHITHFGITHANSKNHNINYKPIGDKSLISRRKEFITPNGKSLGGYIPFYFGIRMPMLYVIQKGYNGVSQIHPEKIVYCVSSVEQILKHHIPFYFTDGHAVDSLSEFYGHNELENIDKIIDLNAIKTKYWKNENDLDIKRRKEAEFLIENDLPSAAVLGFIVYNELSKNKLLAFGIESKKIVIKSDYYF